MNFFNIVTRVLVVIGALVLIVGVSGAHGAPQEAAIAGMAIALAVLPYVMYRVLQIESDAEQAKIRYNAILKRLDTMIEAQEKNSS